MKHSGLALAAITAALLISGTTHAGEFPDNTGKIRLTEENISGKLPEGILNDIPQEYYWNGRKFVFSKEPAKKTVFPENMPAGAVNPTYSPDSTKIAYTKGGDLYVYNVADGKEIRITDDGNDMITSGYASWVYYEEILGRATNYKAFWWSPDSRRIGFYRFDNTGVPVFPIYLSDGQHGELFSYHYPKAGDRNPEVRIGMADISSGEPETVWADFDEKLDQYFGIPFWGDDSREFYIAHMPRVQNELTLYAVNAENGEKRLVYEESYPTWINWMQEIIFEKDGLYMVRDFEGWQQIYFLPYDGSGVKRITSGENWDISLVGVNPKNNDIYFLAMRASKIRRALYRADTEGNITALTDEDYDVHKVVFSDDFKQFAATYSNAVTPPKVSVFRTGKHNRDGSLKEEIIADMKGSGFDSYAIALPETVYLETEDGFILPGQIFYPVDFDPSKKYPVHFDIYGGPDTPMVRDRWRGINDATQWWANNGIIEVIVDNRASGCCGRKGLDMIYRNLMNYELQDFIAWSEYFKSLPYVDGNKIGVEGFSFGGTMTVMCLTKGHEHFNFGIAGGGVYDWMLYDSHYTERYMDTPERNPEGYADKVLNYADMYPTEYMKTVPGGTDGEPVSGHGIDLSRPTHMLKLTHGTADDNVHFQQTMQLVDLLQKEGKRFEMMIYPEGKHGYRGYQAEHFNAANKFFWLKWLKDM